MVPPIHLAATYVQPGAGEWGQFDYSRSGNPTRKALETTLLLPLAHQLVTAVVEA